MTSSYGRKLFWTIAAAMVAFVALFSVYQLFREIKYRSQVISSRLEDYNIIIYDKHSRGESIERIESLPGEYNISGVWTRMVSHSGELLYENAPGARPFSKDEFFASDDVSDALRLGVGMSYWTKGPSTGERRFYMASYFRDGDIVIRSSVPWNRQVRTLMYPDLNFLWISLSFLVLVLVLLWYRTNRITDKVAKEMTRLNAELGYRFDQNAMMKKQMTQNVAHELKTPVASIMGFLETIRSDPDMTEEMKNEFIERSYQQSVRLSDILRDVSLLGRIENNAVSFPKEKVDICSLVDEIIVANSWRLKERDMVMVNLISKGVTVNGNRGLLYSVFRNLTDNAIAYAGKGTSILVETRGGTRKQWMFSFSDNGVGVDDAHLPLLFQRFYRVDKGRSRKLGGTGLGLSIVRNAVILHGGTISAKRANTGGLEFVFTLDK